MKKELDVERVMGFLGMPREMVVKLIKDKKWRDFNKVVKYAGTKEYRDYRLSKKIKLEDYQENMKTKYKELLYSIDGELLSVGSFERGHLLYDVLCDREEVPKELKYHIFYEWWTSIDAYHDWFDSWDIEEWIKEANVKFDYGKLNIDKKGYVKVYRGVNEYSNPEGMSWTTNRDIAEKFANGCRVRGMVNEPKVLEGKVHYWNILAMFWGREESEVLCEIY